MQPWTFSGLVPLWTTKVTGFRTTYIRGRPPFTAAARRFSGTSLPNAALGCLADHRFSSASRQVASISSWSNLTLTCSARGPIWTLELMVSGISSSLKNST